jgi:predicted GNAT family acetyltransferase
VKKYHLLVSILAHLCIFDMDSLLFDGTNSNTMDIYSTNVPGSQEGRGLGKLLADEAFQLAKERGFTIRPSCWYIAGYLRRQEDRSTYLLQFCLF